MDPLGLFFVFTNCFWHGKRVPMLMNQVPSCHNLLNKILLLPKYTEHCTAWTCCIIVATPILVLSPNHSLDTLCQGIKLIIKCHVAFHARKETLRPLPPVLVHKHTGCGSSRWMPHPLFSARYVLESGLWVETAKPRAATSQVYTMAISDIISVNRYYAHHLRFFRQSVGPDGSFCWTLPQVDVLKSPVHPKKL